MATLDQQMTKNETAFEIGNRDAGATNLARAQSFVPTGTSLVSITVNKASTTGTPTGNIVFEVRTNSGGAPTSTVLATKSYTLAQWNAYSNGDVNVPLITAVTSSTTYWLVIRDSASEATNPNYYNVNGSLTGDYGSGSESYSLNGGSSWSNNAAYDLYFKTYLEASSASPSISPSASPSAPGPSFSPSFSPSISPSKSPSSSISPSISPSFSPSFSPSISPSKSPSSSISPSISPSFSQSISLSISPSISPSVSPSPSPEYGLDKLSTSGTYGSVWKSNIYSVGNTFAITEIRIPLGATLATGMTITPKVYLDDGSTVKTMTTINSTNFSGRYAIYKLPEIHDYIGENNFYIELNFSGTVYCPVLLPIKVELDIYEDEP